MSVISATVFTPGAVGHLDQRLARAPAASSRAAMNAPEPVLTSSTSASRPSASFLERIEATISGIDSTVPVASRTAYRRRSAGARSAVWPTIAQPASRTTRWITSVAGTRRVAGDAVELVQRPAGVAEAAAGDHRHRRAARGEDRGEHQRHLVADAAGRVLVEHGLVEVPVAGRVPESRIAGREREPLVGVQAARKNAIASAPTWASESPPSVMPPTRKAISSARQRARRRASCG